jgi:hypothetical protein
VQKPRNDTRQPAAQFCRTRPILGGKEEQKGKPNKADGPQDLLSHFLLQFPPIMNRMEV